MGMIITNILRFLVVFLIIRWLFRIYKTYKVIKSGGIHKTGTGRADIGNFKQRNTHQGHDGEVVEVEFEVKDPK